MKNSLFIISLLFLTSCSYFRENYRETNFKMKSGTAIRLIIFESTSPFRENYLVVYANDYPLKGRDCEDIELKNFSRELWAELAGREDLSKLKSGSLTLLKRQLETKPENCRFTYSKRGDEWIQD